MATSDALAKADGEVLETWSEGLQNGTSLRTLNEGLGLVL